MAGRRRGFAGAFEGRRGGDEMRGDGGGRTYEGFRFSVQITSGKYLCLPSLWRGYLEVWIPSAITKSCPAPFVVAVILQPTGRSLTNGRLSEISVSTRFRHLRQLAGGDGQNTHWSCLLWHGGFRCSEVSHDDEELRDGMLNGTIGYSRRSAGHVDRWPHLLSVLLRHGATYLLCHSAEEA